MIAKEQVLNLAKRYKIDQFYILREYIQVLFLFHFYNLKKSEDVYFKGGTAIRLLYGSFRFSEDLDFSSAVDAKATSELLHDAISNINKELNDKISVEQISIKKNSLISRLKFISQHGAYPLTIHLEFSLREKPLMPTTSQLETLYPISPYPIIKHLGGEEILAEKVRACFVRIKSRDLFDIWYLLTKDVGLNWDIVNKKMAYYKKAVSREEFISRIENIDQSAFTKDLSKFLPSTQRPILKELKPKLLARLKSLTT